uniref:Uncharacterized protein n=1 Tax=Rhabditophanes sp. KR3021 TaxID=114890 RepID=A0AC35TH19_9BILA
MVRSRIDDDRIRVSTYISNQIRARNCAQITNEESKVGRINKGICGPQSIVSSDVSLNDKRKIMSASASTGLQSDSSLRSTPASSLESIDNVIHRSISQVVLERPENVDAHDDKFIIQDEGESSDGGSDHSKR